jgi:hypothetical protein
VRFGEGRPAGSPSPRGSVTRPLGPYPRSDIRRSRAALRRVECHAGQCSTFGGFISKRAAPEVHCLAGTSPTRPPHGSKSTNENSEGRERRGHEFSIFPGRKVHRVAAPSREEADGGAPLSSVAPLPVIPSSGPTSYRRSRAVWISDHDAPGMADHDPGTGDHDGPEHAAWEMRGRIQRQISESLKTSAVFESSLDHGNLNEGREHEPQHSFSEDHPAFLGPPRGPRRIGLAEGVGIGGGAICKPLLGSSSQRPW